jgi:hypothetical protein
MALPPKTVARDEADLGSIKRQARQAGLLYFLLAITAPIGLLVVPNLLIVSRDAAATADRIRASEWLLRLGIASELVHQVIGIFLVLALYRLFKAVNQKHALLMVIFSLIPVPIVMLNVVHELAALTLVHGAPFLSVFEPRQLDALAYLFLRLHTQGINVAAIFWGLWLFPFGMLVIRSGFIPRFLGILMMIAGVAYLVASFTFLLLPSYVRFVDLFVTILEFGEVPIIFWLLIWGAKAQRSYKPASSPASWRS